MKKYLMILVAMVCFGISAYAQGNKLGAHTEVHLKNGTLIYVEEKDNGVGPASGWQRYLLNKVNWPSGFAACATQHDVDYGTIGISKSNADNKLRSCARSVFPGTVGDFAKQQNLSVEALCKVYAMRSISEGKLFADFVYELMAGSEGNDSYRQGQQMAQTTEKYKREVEEALGMSIDTRRYYFILMN